MCNVLKCFKPKKEDSNKERIIHINIFFKRGITIYNATIIYCHYKILVKDFIKEWNEEELNYGPLKYYWKRR